MKKLLIALTAAASAFGLYADVAIGGAGFDSVDEAPLTWTTDGFDATFWSGTEGTMTLVTPGDSGKLSTERPAGFSVTDRDGYMALKTTLGSPVFQNVKTSGAVQTIDPNFFYDGLVQFTAFDETPDMAAYSDAKIGIFPMLENPDSDTAYLWVYANGNPTNLWKTTKVIDGAWHRVTIKMIKNVTRTAGAVNAGFVVFIDGEAVNADNQAAFAGLDLNPAAQAYFNNGQLFRSLDPTANEFTGVAYDGQGLLDEVGFTDLAGAPEFTLDANWATVSWTSDKIAKVYVTDGESVVAESTTGFVDFVRAAETTYYYYYDAVSGYIGIGADDAVEITAATTAITDEPAAAAFEIGSTPYATWADAVAAASGDVTITLKGAYTMDEDDLAASIENEGGLTTIDFAGSVLTGEVQAATAIKFVDSGKESVGGIVGILNSDEMLEAVFAEGAVYIEGGKFDGLLICDDTTDGITGGMFLEQDPGATEFALAGSVADGYVAELADSYWTIVEDTMVEFAVTAGENSKAAVKINDLPVEDVPEKLNQGDTYEVTFTANEGYAFAQGAQTVFSGTAADEAITIEGPDAAALPIVAYIGQAGFYTLADAVTAAKDDEEITIAADINDVDITISKKITIDATGYTLTGKQGVYAIRVWDGDLTIAGGTFKTEDTTSNSLFLVGDTENVSKAETPVVYTGALTIEDGSFGGVKVGNLIKVSKGTCDVKGGEFTSTNSRGIKADGADAVVTINGGTINLTDKKALAVDAGGQITINAGTINGSLNNEGGDGSAITIPGTSTATFNADQSGFCADGYKTLNNGADRYAVFAAKTINVTAGTGIATVKSGDVDVTGDVTIKETDVPFTVTLTAAVGIESPVFKIAVNGDPAVVVTSPFTFEDYAAIVEGAQVVFTAEAGAAPIIDPTDPESKQTVEAEGADEAVAKAEIKVPNAAKDAVDAATYKTYFNFTATPAGVGKFEVAISGLKAEVVEAPTTADLVANFDEIGEDGLTVVAKPGLFYGVKQAAAVDGVAAAKIETEGTGLATTSEVKLPVAKQGDAGFYKVVVDVKPFN